MTYQININKINPQAILNCHIEILNLNYCDVNSDQARPSVLNIIIRNPEDVIFEFLSEQHYTYWLLKYS